MAALVLAMGETGLGVAKCLGRRGIEVYGADFCNDAVGFSSKYCRQKLNTENPVKYPEECLKSLISFGRNLSNKAVLMPASDAYVTFLSRYRDELEPYFLFNIPSVETLGIIVDKSRQYDIAQRLGIQIPKTFSPLDMNDLAQLAVTLTYPVFVKGTNSPQWAQHMGTKKGFVAESPSELMKIYNEILQKELRAIIQEIVIGPNTNHYKVCAYYSQKRELLAIFCTQKIRQFPVDFGVGTYMRSTYDESLINLGCKLFEGLDYTGIGSIEFKKDDRDGEFKLMELNPRFWQQNIQATIAGVDFPFINYLDCMGIAMNPSLEFKTDINYVDVIMDLMSYLNHKHDGGRHLFQWACSVLRANSFAYISADDLWTSLSYARFLGRKGLMKMTDVFK